MSQKPKILFVDDQPEVLEGLRTSFRCLRQDWALAFAKDGPEAIEILNKVPFNVILTNPGLLGIDDTPLLNTVMRKYPSIVRVALLGESWGNEDFRSIYPAHICFFRPYEPTKLKRMLIRAAALHVRLADQRLGAVVSRMTSLPEMPSLYPDLMELMASKNTSIQRVGKIVSRDEEITASLLELAGSTFFQGTEQVDSLVQAVGLLGVETVEGLVLSAEIYRQFEEEEIRELTGVPLRDHNMSVSIFSKEIARLERADRELQGKAFMAGMLHDTGKLLLAANFPDLYKKVIAATAAKHLNVADAERGVYGVSHAEVGAYLLSLWGFPDFMIEAMAFHHHPGCIPCQGFSLAAAVHVADSLAYAAGSEPIRGAKIPQVDQAQLNKLGLAERYEVWKKHCLGLLETASD